MAQNPPNYFAPGYFATNYWGGQQPEGSISAHLMGTSAMTAVLTATESAYTGGSYVYRRKRYPLILTQPKPVNIAARIAGAGGIAASSRAVARIAARFGGISEMTGPASAIAAVAAAIVSIGQCKATGEAVDRWRLARMEDEFWLIAA